MKRWKKIMALCFAFLMSFVMLGSSVEAANGPNEQDWSSAYIVIDDGSANPKQLYNANKSVTISTVRNISYDKKTNTGVDECMIWGDYFYLEALTRLAKSWYSFW